MVIMTCQGKCSTRKECKGQLMIVDVFDECLTKYWGEFVYCEGAIETDRQAGLKVTIKTPV